MSPFRSVKVRTAARLRRIAVRLDPPTDPYGEWDAASRQLVIKIPNGAGEGLPLARVNISPGQVFDQKPSRLG